MNAIVEAPVDVVDELGGLTPKDWIAQNWRRFVYGPNDMPRAAVGDHDRWPSFQGIYFLWSGGRLLYVGLAKDVAARLAQHVDAGMIPFDEMSAFAAPGRKFEQFFLNAIETVYIRSLSPPYNRHRGRGGYLPETERMMKIVRRLWRDSSHAGRAITPAAHPTAPASPPR